MLTGTREYRSVRMTIIGACYEIENAFIVGWSDSLKLHGKSLESGPHCLENPLDRCWLCFTHRSRVSHRCRMCPEQRDHLDSILPRDIGEGRQFRGDDHWMIVLGLYSLQVLLKELETDDLMLMTDWLTNLGGYMKVAKSTGQMSRKCFNDFLAK